MTIHVYHPYRQPDGENFCQAVNGHCSHLCLPAPKITDRSPRISCACPTGLKLMEDGLMCVEDGESIKFYHFRMECGSIKWTGDEWMLSHHHYYWFAFIKLPTQIFKWNTRGRREKTFPIKFLFFFCVRSNFCIDEVSRLFRNRFCLKPFFSNQLLNLIYFPTEPTPSPTVMIFLFYVLQLKSIAGAADLQRLWWHRRQWDQRWGRPVQRQVWNQSLIARLIFMIVRKI